MRKGWFNQSYRHSLASKGIRTSMAGYENGLLKEAAAPLVPQTQPVVQSVEPAMIQQQVESQPAMVVEPRKEYATLGEVLRDIDKNTLESQHKPGAYKNFGDLLKDIQKAAFSTKISGKKASMAMKDADKERIKKIMDSHPGGIFGMSRMLKAEGFKTDMSGSDYPGAGMVLRVKKGKDAVLVGSKKNVEGKAYHEKDGLVMGDEE